MAAGAHLACFCTTRRIQKDSVLSVVFKQIITWQHAYYLTSTHHAAQTLLTAKHTAARCVNIQRAKSAPNPKRNSPWLQLRVKKTCNRLTSVVWSHWKCGENGGKVVQEVVNSSLCLVIREKRVKFALPWPGDCCFPLWSKQDDKEERMGGRRRRREQPTEESVRVGGSSVISVISIIFTCK